MVNECREGYVDRMKPEKRVAIHLQGGWSIHYFMNLFDVDWFKISDRVHLQGWNRFYIVDMKVKL